MKIAKWLLGIFYKLFIIIRERFFLIPASDTTPPRPSPVAGGGLGGGESPHKIEGEQALAYSLQVTGVEAEQERPSESEKWDTEIPPLLEDQRVSLCETLDRVLNKGVVAHGDITISVANIDLVYIGLRALLTSVETVRRLQDEPSKQNLNRKGIP